MTKRSLFILLALVWLLTSVARPARAQAPAEQAALDACLADARCKELADRGQAEYQAQQHDAALASLREAYSVQPVPWLLFNIGRIHQNAGRTDEALAAFRAFLQQSQAADEAGQREKARVFVEQIERERVVVEKPLINPPPPHQKKPIYKKWWFWTIIGGVIAAGAVAGVAGGVTSSSQLPGPVIRPF